jgi:hypothetical protein
LTTNELEAGLKVPRKRLEKDLALARKTGDGLVMAKALLNIGRAKMRQGQNDRARLFLEEGLTLAEELKDAWRIGTLSLQLGILAYRQKKYRESESLLRKTLVQGHETGGKYMIAWALLYIAWLKTLQKRYGTAARLFAESQAIREEMKTPVAAKMRGDLEQIICRVRTHLGQKAFEAEWQAGLGMDAAEAVEYGLAATDSAGQELPETNGKSK